MHLIKPNKPKPPTIFVSVSPPLTDDPVAMNALNAPHIPRPAAAPAPAPPGPNVAAIVFVIESIRSLLTNGPMIHNKELTPMRPVEVQKAFAFPL